MTEQHITRERCLANERALYRYNQALERGDIETIATILREASHNEELERMIFAMHDLEQPAERPLAFASEHQAPEAYPVEPVLFSQPERSPRPPRARRRLQVLAALLVVAVLIAGSVLLFTSRRPAPGPANHAVPPPSRTATPSPTKAVVTAQGTVILLFTNGDVEAVRGGTGQRLWSYSTGLSDLGDPNLPTYRGLIVQNQAVYVMAKNKIFALNEQTGHLLWQKKLPASFYAITPQESQIVLDNGMLYFSLESERQSVMYALRASDGQLLWQVTSVDVDPPLLTASNGTVYVAIENAAMTQTILQARRGSDGHILWSYTSPGAISFATVAHNVLYVDAFTGAAPANCCTKQNKRLLAFKAGSGDLIWSRDVQQGNYTANIAYIQGVLIVPDGYAQLCAYSASNGSQLWCLPDQPNYNGTGATIGGYLAGPDKLYVALAGQTGLQIEALNVRNGRPEWTSPLASNSQGAPFGPGQAQFGLLLSQHNTLLVSTGSPLLTALDASSGHQLWQINGSASQPSLLLIVGAP